MQLARPLTINPVTTAVGAEILGVDLAQPLDDETFALIRQTYVDRGALFFRGQRLDSDRFIAFARRFGPLTCSNMKQYAVDGYDEIEEVRKNEGDPAVNGGEWHTDQSFRATPIMGTMLVARKVPPYGGDTIFVNMAAAFDALSEGLKRTLRGLRAVHTNAHRPMQIKKQAEMAAAGHVVPFDEVVHPVVGRHPENRREVLYVNRTYTVRFEGWTAAESEPLLRHLFAHITKPEFGCRFRWDDGSLAFWDNRQCQHYAVNDYPGGTRSHHRLMVEGPFLEG
jgi:taurine dioxygenase